MGRNRHKLNIPMCAALALFVLTMISIHITSGLFARYTATAEGSDSARVAKFQVTTNYDKNMTLSCTPTAPGESTVVVTNQSEVAVKYAIDVVFTEAVPADKILVTMDGEKGTWSDDGKTLRFGEFDSLNPNGDKGEHTVQFSVLDWTYITSTAQGTASAEKAFDFVMNVVAEQID